MSLKHGGARSGAGRKKGSGPYGESTRVIRVPESKVSAVKNWLARQIQQNDALTEASIQRPLNDDEIVLPRYSSKVVAGFPQDAEDHIDSFININQTLVKNPEDTFVLNVQGDSMMNAGIFDGDMLLVDRRLEPKSGKIVIAAVNGELTVKRLRIDQEGTFLMPENEAYPPLKITEEMDLKIWGVVTSCIRDFM